VRYVGGGGMTDFFRASLDGVRREQDYLACRGHTGPLAPAVYMAISGGGDTAWIWRGVGPGAGPEVTTPGAGLR
jgi:hypothetical protein